MSKRPKEMKTTNSSKSILQQMNESNLLNIKKSIGIKLFLIIFISILACVLTVGLMSYSKARTLIEQNASEFSLQTVTQVANNMDVVFETFDDLSLQILTDKAIQEAIIDISEGKDDYTRLQSTRTMSEKLANYLMSSRSITAAALIPVGSGQSITAGTASSILADKNKEESWFEQTIEASGRINWIEPQPEGILVPRSAPSIALSRLIKNMSSGTNDSYVLVFEIPVSNLAERYSHVALGENSQLMIVNKENKLVIHNEQEQVGNVSSVESSVVAEDEVEESVRATDESGTSYLAVYKSFEAIPQWKLAGLIPIEELVKDAKPIQTTTWIIVAVAMLLAIIIGIIVIRIIAIPLVKLCALMLEGSKGDLTVRAANESRSDEIGQLSSSFNKMMGQIEMLAVQTTSSAEEVLQTASELTDASKKTAIAAKEIAAATEEIAKGATSLAVEAEKGSDMTGSINRQMHSVTEANQEMSDSAVAVEQASGRGTTYMGTLMEKTGVTEEMTRSMAEKVKALQDSTGSIVKILDVLTSIMQQTNILSLNAAIEAARAGNAGKGFMVVADEIRKLAEQSKQSIDVVGQITATIQLEIEETVQVLSDAYPLFQEQVESVKEANQIFMSVQGQMGQFVQKLEHVTDSIKELDHSQTVLADAMTSVSAVAEEASATSEEVASLSSEQLSVSENLVGLSNKLDAVSRGLKESLMKFKIK